MPKAKINDISLYYEVRGRGEPLLLIAGLGSDSASWSEVIKDLSLNFKTIAFDNRGCGRSDNGSSECTIALMAEDAVRLLDYLEIEKAHILGHSMGGCIAQEIAIEYPKRVNKLILASTCAVLSQENKSIFSDLLKVLEDGSSYQSFIREFFRLIFTPEYLSNKNTAEGAVKSALNYPFPITPKGFRLQLEALNNFNSKDSLKEIEARTLIIAGGKDALITSEEAQLLSDKISFSEFLCLKNMAHSFFLENPAIFTEKIIDFLLTK